LQTTRAYGRRVRRPTIVFVLLAAAAALAGCGGSGSGPAGAPQTTAALLTTPNGKPVSVPRWATRAAAYRPVPVSAFSAPEANYRRFALAQLTHTSAGMAKLQRALAGNHRRAGRAAWRATWTAYLHAGLSYGALSQLDQAIDGTPANGDTFQGLHLIEQALWQNGDLRSLAPTATVLQSDVKQLQTAVTRQRMTSLTYTLRPHELLDDARTNLLTGSAVPWSREGIAGAAAELAATQAIVGTLAPMLSERGPALDAIDGALSQAQDALYAIRGHHHNTWPTLAKAKKADLRTAMAAMTAASNAVRALPQALPSNPPETAPR
jgi:iron uptake system EfeUOB component EfeO/EfeM